MGELTAPEAGGADCCATLGSPATVAGETCPATAGTQPAAGKPYFDQMAMPQVSCQPAAWTLVLAVGTGPA